MAQVKGIKPGGLAAGAFFPSPVPLGLLSELCSLCEQSPFPATVPDPISLRHFFHLMATHAFHIPLDNIIARAREAGCSVFSVSSSVFLIFPSGYCLSIPARDINLLRSDLKISFLGAIDEQNLGASFRRRRVSRYVLHIVSAALYSIFSVPISSSTLLLSNFETLARR